MLKPEIVTRFGCSPFGRRRYWTRERMLVALKDFMTRHRGPLPAKRRYDRKKRGHPEWPPADRVLEEFGSFAAAWEAVGSEDRVCYSHLPWTEDQDDELLEHAGLMTLEQLGRRLGRTAQACSDRLQVLGTPRALDISGYLTLSQVAREYGCPESRVRKLIASGQLAAFRVRGGHHWRIDPDDAEAARELLTAPCSNCHNRGRAARRVPDGWWRPEARRKAIALLEQRGLIVEVGA